MERTSNVKVNIIEYFGDLEEIYGYEKSIEFENKIFDLYKEDRQNFEKWANENNIELDNETLEMWEFKING
jgi:hypothetical protein